MNFVTDLIGQDVLILEGMNEGLAGTIRMIRVTNDEKVIYTVEPTNRMMAEYTSKDFMILREKEAK